MQQCQHWLIFVISANLYILSYLFSYMKLILISTNNLWWIKDNSINSQAKKTLRHAYNNRVISISLTVSLLIMLLVRTTSSIQSTIIRWMAWVDSKAGRPRAHIIVICLSSLSFSTGYNRYCRIHVSSTAMLMRATVVSVCVVMSGKPVNVGSLV